MVNTALGTQVLRLLFAHSNELIALEDPEKGLQYTSASWKIHLEWAEEELIGARLVDLLRLEGSAPASSVPARTPQSGLVRHRRGHWKPTEWHSLALDETPLRVHIGRLLLDPLPSGQELIEQKDLEMDVLVHELRTALHGVLGGLTLLAREPCSSAAEEHIHFAYRAAAHMHAIIEQTLNKTPPDREESSPVDSAPELLDLQLLLRDVREICEASVLPATPPEITVECDPALGQHISGPGTHVRQILINLLKNAVKFCPEGPIHLAARRAQEGVLFEVTDQGPGMSEEELKQLFRPRYQGRAGQAFGGSGLGLFTTRKLLQALGGTLHVTSRLGQGTTFLATLPLPPGRGGL